MNYTSQQIEEIYLTPFTKQEKRSLDFGFEPTEEIKFKAFIKDIFFSFMVWATWEVGEFNYHDQLDEATDFINSCSDVEELEKEFSVF